ncbi:MAG: family 20 glycosylhydrolase [Bacteroidales bacterium]
MNLKTVIIAFAITALPMVSAAQNMAEINLIPKPQNIVAGEGFFKITPNTAIISQDTFSGHYLRDKLLKATKYNINVFEKSSNEISGKHNCFNICLSDSYSIPREGYELSVTPAGVFIKASDKAGIFYAIQTILQLLPPTIYGNATGWEKWEIPAVEIKDYPRFSYRGMHLDVSRTFFDKDIIYNYLDWLSYHKINTFHWHLTDDNGWRLEIKKYPFLTEKGAWRGPNEVIPAAYGSGNKRYGGFYTQEDIKAIIQYAADRNIEIIPEFDMPGHSKAVIGSYPHVGCDNTTEFISVNGEVKNVWCVGKADNYKMLDHIIKEVAQLFPSKVIHIGGDEVNMDNWKECPVCQAFMKEKGMKNEIELLNYFVRQLEKIVNKHGKVMAGWDEILDGGELRKDTRIYAWRSVEKGIEAVKKGKPTVMQVAEYCYYDMKQTPPERGHNWAGIVTLEKAYSFNPIGKFEGTLQEQTLILGPQGGLWGELLNKPVRFMEYQNYPRTCALAEIGWTNQELRNFDDFNYRLTKTHYERLFNMGIAFRLPYPNVVYENKTLKVTPPYDWAIVRYTTDGSNPTFCSTIYKGDIVTYEPQNFRFATFYKDILKSITVSANNLSTTYLTPEVSIETSFGEQPRFPIKNATDYNFKTYWRTNRTGKAGDFVTYNFAEPVACKKITVETGIPNIDLYGVTDGYIEYSYDGIHFIKGDAFVENIAVLKPKEKVKTVRIVLTDLSDALTVCFQSLRIE